MIVKNLILSCDESEILKELQRIHGNKHIQSISGIIESIINTEPIISDDTIHAEYVSTEETEEYLDVTVMEGGNDVKFSFMCSPWSDILGWKIENKTVAEIGAVTLSAEIIWEMTWFGGTAEEVDRYLNEDTGDGDVYEYDEDKKLWKYSEEAWEEVEFLTVRDFILTVSKEKIAEYWQDKYFPEGCMENIMKGIDFAYAELECANPVSIGTLMSCIEHTGSEAGDFDACVREKDFIGDSIPMNYYWSESLGSQVSEHNIERYGKVPTAAEFLWELTIGMSTDIEVYLEWLKDGKESRTFEVAEIFHIRQKHNEEALRLINRMWNIMDIRDGSMKKGVFWLIDGELKCFPFDETRINGIAKSGDTYNHKKLWEYVKPKGCNKPYNYYPRGRVEISNKGNPIVYMNGNIDENTYIEVIKREFSLDSDPKVHIDCSYHYECYLDNGWIPD